ncbi:hypothetical protein JQ557_10670 [Bradyrhizobium sp. U87765 SZCCT0131]|uniref:hypothetical protein n=1 Tax=unclassified Bradyrhizobium TaxID=2631580 RepID=UPI001BA99ED6|nr:MULTISPECIES: hypothetical protein [unclassified Bradyrhizobium]MBR1218454.1 hypothetical protein [Bradyrhizobium sp. U87765 SZCCT0131]MBR1260600.1 hypothetical protein [Bradyrhizobium sp. U87765 SZCCT0134]MBR1303952.1 hypothetical protein [Bradyrhizobium sp. U87765 SZCCT0110]MBR1319558.1 hypothetical protein [Bradyrhizobium sp. U87765 SZCCT0109]MBR1347883.1 hypothetical protein [Bradyrhizobium sp. U87765 SZCCT0048]
MKKTLSAFLAVATIAGSLAVAMPAAQADGGRIAAGVAGGLIGGALLGSALAGAAAAPPPPPAYYAPGPAYVVEPECRWVRERFWDGYGWRFRRVQACD